MAAQDSMTTSLRKIQVTNGHTYKKDSPLLSIHLASNRPQLFTEFVKEIHASCINKNCYEIIVKIDTEDQVMIERVNALVTEYGSDKIKPFVSPRKNGPWSTWEAYNDMFLMTHPNAYFLWNPSDEVRIDTYGWDKLLEDYIGFFDDHIFRLKLSDNRLRNFYYLHEVLGSPDNFPFITKKWMDICGLWGDCHSPDLFHQAVAYYLGKKEIFRDIPIFDIQLSGIEAGLLIAPEKQEDRSNNIHNLWKRALSYKIRKRYLAHANKLAFYIKSCKESATMCDFKEDLVKDHLVCRNNLGQTHSVYLKDYAHFIDVWLWNWSILQTRLKPFNLKVKSNILSKIVVPFYKLTSLLVCIQPLVNRIALITKKTVKKKLGWYTFSITDMEHKRDHVKLISAVSYLLVADNTCWRLFYFDKNKKEIEIPTANVRWLDEVLGKPGMPYSYIDVTKAITYYHVSVTLNISNNLLLKKLALD